MTKDFFFCFIERKKREEKKERGKVSKDPCGAVVVGVWGFPVKNPTVMRASCKTGPGSV